MVNVVRKSPFMWEIPKEGGMRVPGRIYANDRLMADLRNDRSLEQVANVAHLPGIVGYSWAMPDIHLGYGFPIGGVAATAYGDGGVISPGGVGYDINCGVRLTSSDVTFSEVRGKIDDIVLDLFRSVPCGPSPHESGFGDLSADELRKVMRRGASYVVDHGLGSDSDIENCEENGRLEGADPGAVSERAVERGRRQLGSIGSGNHFLEVGYVEEVYETEIARVLGLDQGRMTILIHCGSRGFGHQVCTDYLRTMATTRADYGFQLPDRQLAASPLDSEIGRSYLAAMAAAANFAWANRQTLMVLAERSVASTLGSTPDDLGFRLVYDVCHNIAKTELHDVEGKRVKVCVHRKGATRALPPGDDRIPASYRSVGQPVLVPGDMARASYVLVGDAGSDQAFSSSCHGAGRRLSRSAALRQGRGRSLLDELRAHGVVVMAKDRRTLAEEMPEAYKDVSEVIEVLQGAGVIRKVVRLKPVGVIKG
jgi:tRNA-splicing ligase RtcB